MKTNNVVSIFLIFFQKKTPIIILLFTCLGSLIPVSHSSQRYFMCGGDEMGCIEGMYQYCICIPYNDIEANNAYCLDFDIMKCTPLSQTSNCKAAFIFKNQNECLATLFQSEMTPPCKITTYAFCLNEHATVCDPNGQLDSCHST